MSPPLTLFSISSRKSKSKIKTKIRKEKNNKKLLFWFILNHVKEETNWGSFQILATQNIFFKEKVKINHISDDKLGSCNQINPAQFLSSAISYITCNLLLNAAVLLLFYLKIEIICLSQSCTEDERNASGPYFIIFKIFHFLEWSFIFRTSIDSARFFFHWSTP